MDKTKRLFDVTMTITETNIFTNSMLVEATNKAEAYELAQDYLSSLEDYNDWRLLDASTKNGVIMIEPKDED